MSEVLRGDAVTAAENRMIVRKCPGCKRVLLKGQNLGGTVVLRCRDCKQVLKLDFKNGVEVDAKFD